MHRDLPAERDERIVFAFRLQRDDHRDAAEAVDDLAVHVLADRAVFHMQPSSAAQRDVLADGGDRVGDRVRDRAAAREMRAPDGLGVDARALVDGDRENAAHQRLEVVVAGDEVGLGIDFDDDAEIGFHGGADEAVGGDASALLGRLGEALLAQPVDRRLDFTVRFAERGLAIHHAGTGLLAQFLHQRGGDRGHGLSLVPRWL